MLDSTVLTLLVYVHLDYEFELIVMEVRCSLAG